MRNNLILVLFLVVGFVLISSFNDESHHQNIKKELLIDESEGLSQIIESIPLNKSYNFANEILPLHKRDVVERLDRELTVNSYWHSSTVLNIKNSRRYFPLIEKILREEGIPEDFKYLAVAESNLRNVTSSAGAKGIWQFLNTTAKQYGLEINSNVDERYHIEKATRSACKYLKYLQERFGSWTLAAAAYNGGETKIARLLKEQYASDFYELNLSEETMRYVFRIVAIKEILHHPEKYGFNIDKKNGYPPLDSLYTIEVSENIDNLGLWAKKFGSDYRSLKYYNPWLRTSKLPVSLGNSYEILLPKRPK